MTPVIDIDPNSGFCFGVVTAISKAEEELSKSGKLYCLGDIVHNQAEVQRLADKGLKTVDHSQFRKLKDVSVLLRAHGEPPSTYEMARMNGITLVDATCPVVLKLQQRIKKEYDQAIASGQELRIVIYGQPGHAEVNGLVGQTDSTATVIESPDQVKNLDPHVPVALYSQTTKSLEGFNEIIEAIHTHLAPGVKFTHYDTICRQVSNRVQLLRQFAQSHQVVLFVAGNKSSNGHVLFNHCHQVNPCTYAVASPDGVDMAWLEGKTTIGICGATSTPRWLMEQVANHIKNRLSTDE